AASGSPRAIRPPGPPTRCRPLGPRGPGMRLPRRVRVTCLASIAALGVPLLLSGTTGTTPAVGAELHPVHLYRNRHALIAAEQQRERPGYLKARAAYFDARRLSGDKPLSVAHAAQLR